MKMKKKSLVTTLLVGVAASILLFNVIQIIVIGKVDIKIQFENSCENYKRIAVAYAEAIQNKIEGYFLAMDRYMNSDEVKEGSSQDIIDFINQEAHKRNALFDYVLYALPDGTAYTDSGVTANIYGRSYFNAIFNEGKSEFIANPVISKTTGRPVVHVTRAVVQKGRTVGLMCGVVSVESIVNLVNEIKIGDEGYSWLLASDGMVISHPRKEYNLTKNFITDVAAEGYGDMAELAKEIVKGQTGWGWVKGLDGGKDLIAYTGVDNAGWGLAFSIPQREIYESIYKTIMMMVIAGALTIVVMLVFIGLVLIKTLQPLRKVEHAIMEIASGNADLTKRIDYTGNNEIGLVVSGFNGFTGKLQTIISEVKSSEKELSQFGESLALSAQDTGSSITQILANIESLRGQIVNQSASVEETAGAVNQIASNIDSLNRMIENQTSRITQASAAIEEMIGNISSINGIMDRMSKSFSDLQEHSESGYSKQQVVNEQIEKIEAQSAMLQEANSVISSIAEQTNLLAMNAAIEAAHAGDAGKGFSVVADEIRKLSETSTTQSKAIGEQLNQIKDSISEVVSSSEESSNAFKMVSQKIQDTVQLVTQIKGALSEQNEGSKQISDTIVSLNDNSSEVKGASTEMSQGNQAILEEVKRLQDATSVMKDSMEEMSVGAKKINETGTVLNEISSQVKGSIDKISGQIDQFKV